jgi:hypothetical protein
VGNGERKEKNGEMIVLANIATLLVNVVAPSILDDDEDQDIIKNADKETWKRVMGLVHDLDMAVLGIEKPKPRVTAEYLKPYSYYSQTTSDMMDLCYLHITLSPIVAAIAGNSDQDEVDFAKIT